MGTSPCQAHLRHAFVCTKLWVNKPEVLVGAAHEKFDAAGELTDKVTRDKVRALFEALAVWTKRLNLKAG